MSINFLTPYPGTKVATDLVKRGLMKESSWSLSDQTASTALRTKYLNSADLERVVRYAYKKFYLRPSYMMSKIREIRSFDDFVRLGKAFINSMDLIR